MEALTKEEKLRRRQERLQAWKQRAPGENKQNPSSEDKQEALEAWKLRKQKEHDRQQRLEQWKKTRSQTPEAPAKTFSIKATIKQKPKTPKPELPHKRALFTEEDDEVQRPKFKMPSLAAARKSRPDGEDDLDTFMLSLGRDETPVLLDNQIEEEEPEEEDPEDAAQDKLRQLQMKLNKGKELQEVDHAAMEYAPFRKNFYREVSEVAALTDEQVAAIRLQMDDIKVAGADVPKPIQKWVHLGMSSVVMDTIDALGYDKPSAIQSQALPAIMSGRDVIGIAKTGSGKTVSFVLPLLRHIQDQPPLAEGDGPIGLILSPTRELALQIYRELTKFTKLMNIRACCCYGGSAIETQIADLKRGAEIIVGTPGRVIDLLAANSGRVTNLGRTTYVVLDEADRMFDMGFEPQVTKVFTQVRPDRQTVLFSATFPKRMEVLAKKILANPVEISVGGVSVVAAEITQKVELFEAKHKSPEEVEEAKFTRLVEVLQSASNKVLIFVEKQASADNLLVKLLRAQHPCLVIHGGMDQVDRKHAIKEFSAAGSGVDILIATSIAARGLDVKQLDLVINYDAPSHMEDYVHRVGRTGRAGNTGTAVTFVTSRQERCVVDLVRALKLSNSEIPPRLDEISTKFLDKVKAGKEKLYLGFGGRGLDNLQEIRDTTRSLERKQYDVEPEGDAAPAKFKVELPDFNVVKGYAPEHSGPNAQGYYSRISINDLPQKARWIVMNSESLSFVTESTHTSITNRGQYYGAHAPAPVSVKKGAVELPAKLYLLVEGSTEQAVRDANNLLRQKMIEGLEAAAKDDAMAPQKKYLV